MHGLARCLFVLSCNHVLKSFWNGPSIAFFSTGHGQYRSPYAARHTCQVWPRQGRLWSQCNQIGREYVYSLFGAVYTASRFAVRQVQQVCRFLELFVELRTVPVGCARAWSGRYVLVCVRTNSSIAYLKWNLARSSKNALCAA